MKYKYCTMGVGMEYTGDDWPVAEMVVPCAPARSDTFTMFVAPALFQVGTTRTAQCTYGTCTVYCGTGSTGPAVGLNVGPYTPTIEVTPLQGAGTVGRENPLTSGSDRVRVRT